MADDRPLAIGQFSQRCRLSVRMLRHYHQHGVLVPDHIDDGGRRWYAPEQLADAADVRRLRDVGFSVAAMPALLAARGTPALADALRAQRVVVEQERRDAAARVRAIDRMIDQVRGQDMSIEIDRRTTVPMTVVALRGTIPTYSDEGQLWGRMMPELERQGIRPTGPGGVFEHDPTYVERDPDESVYLPVAPGTTAEAPLEVVDVPAQEVVVARVVGPYDQISDAHALIGDRVTTDGLTFAEPAADGLVGKVFNTYYSDPSSTPEDEQVTEVHHPVVAG
ncbi:MerR family transcriptional regulator [Georgenia sp. Z1344]|uniref:MerR family transcriptional regulator n=1 Tax=Georgenia sp. Z1344 TaxID=3416706 RepID=UPI003CFB2636